MSSSGHIFLRDLGSDSRAPLRESESTFDLLNSSLSGETQQQQQQRERQHTTWHVQPASSINQSEDDWPNDPSLPDFDAYTSLHSSAHPRSSKHSNLTGMARWKAFLTSSRCKTACTLACGAALIIIVLVIFIVLLKKNLSHTPPEQTINRNVFRIQLLGQSVLRYDLNQDQNTTDFASLVSSWFAGWSATLIGEFVVTDLETAVTGPYGGFDWRQNVYSHIAPPTTIQNLLSLGVTTFMCSNNHAWDLGFEGLWNMLTAISSYNLTCPGLGVDAAHARAAITIPDRSGKGINLAILAMASGNINASAVAGASTPGVNNLQISVDGVPDPDDLAVQIAAIDAAVASDVNDMVAVYHHNHYQSNASAPPELVESWRVDLAHTLLDHGAQLYFSHGQPCLQGIELYKGGVIFYGLGNFMFQSRAGPAHWGADAYEGILIDMEMGCTPCAGNYVPVASITGALRPIVMAMVDRVAHRRVRKLLSSAGPVSATWEEMGTDGLEEDDRPVIGPIMPRTATEQRDTRSTPAGVESVFEPPTLPTPSAPSTRSACACGYRASSLLLRPVLIVRPDQPTPTEMAFNNSWGLPTLSMPITQATTILERVQRLSATFGTKMEIIRDFGEEQPQIQPQQSNERIGAKEYVLSQVFARVNLEDLGP